jgi:hypothetical protein
MTQDWEQNNKDSGVGTTEQGFRTGNNRTGLRTGNSRTRAEDWDKRRFQPETFRTGDNRTRSQDWEQQNKG